MSIFNSRSSGYRAGVFLLFFATAAYIVGYALPFWSSTETRLDYYISSSNLRVTYNIHEGLWQVCVEAEAAGYSATGCQTYGVSGLPGWHHAVRGLSCLCLVMTVIACCYALAVNCCRSIPGTFSRALEIISGIGGVLGLVGSIVYVAMRNDSNKASDLSETYLVYFFSSQDWKFNVSFYLAIIASCLCIVAAIIIGVCNKPLDPVVNTGGVVMHSVPMTQTNMGYTAHSGYPMAQTGYPVAQAGYPQAQAGYTQAGYPQAGYPAVQPGGAPVKAGY